MAGRLQHRYFLLFIVVFVSAAPLFAVLMQGAIWALLLAFDVAAAAFVASVLWSMSDATPDTMRERAERDAAGRGLLILVTVICLLIVLVALTLETRSASSIEYGVPAALATLGLAWIFGNLVFALQYAHRFYERVGAGDRGGLDFPDCDTPAYADFCYFSFVVGMTFQVSDVTINDSGMRRLCLAHALIAFFFNIGVLALSVNILAGSG